MIFIEIYFQSKLSTIMLGILIKFLSSLILIISLLSLTLFLLRKLLATLGKSSSENSSNSERKKDTQNKHEDTQQSPWQVLGIKQGALKTEIEAAYKKKIKENHPDKVATLDPYFHKIANERLKSINLAYQELISQL
jgi:preprotein translocase subunit Sec63